MSLDWWPNRWHKKITNDVQVKMYRWSATRTRAKLHVWFMNKKYKRLTSGYSVSQTVPSDCCWYHFVPKINFRDVKTISHDKNWMQNGDISAHTSYFSSSLSGVTLRLPPKNSTVRVTQAPSTIRKDWGSRYGPLFNNLKWQEALLPNGQTTGRLLHTRMPFEALTPNRIVRILFSSEKSQTCHCIQSRLI